MTNQEAIKIFKAHIESAKVTADFCEKTGRGDISYFEKNIESYKLAIAALEALEAMDPIPIVSEYADGNPVYDFWECPCCGEDFEIDEKYNFCPECGQRMKRE